MANSRSKNPKFLQYWRMCTYFEFLPQLSLYLLIAALHFNLLWIDFTKIWSWIKFQKLCTYMYLCVFSLLWKLQKFTLTGKKIRQINYLVISLVTTRWLRRPLAAYYTKCSDKGTYSDKGTQYSDKGTQYSDKGTFTFFSKKICSSSRIGPRSHTKMFQNLSYIKLKPHVKFHHNRFSGF